MVKKHGRRGKFIGLKSQNLTVLGSLVASPEALSISSNNPWPEFFQEQFLKLHFLDLGIFFNYILLKFSCQNFI